MEVSIGANRIAYQQVGQGPPLLLVHGWPLSRRTYDALVPYLAEHFTCILPDTPGLGESEWTEETDFGFPGQARALSAFADELGLERFSLLAHDSGGTIARLLARDEPARVEKFVLLNTEMPGHRPPFVRLYQALGRLPGLARLSFSMLMRSRAFLRSPMGFGWGFYDKGCIDDALVARHVTPLLESPRRMEGVVRYLMGLEWSVIDGLTETHAKIAAPVKLIWGADDRFFPVGLARRMADQLQHCAGFVEIARARLFVHEERPEAVSRAALPFLLE